MSIRHPFRLACALALGLTLAACGGGTTDDASEDTAAEQTDDGSAAGEEDSGDDAASSEDMGEMADPGSFPVTVDTVAGEVTIEEQPQRIVSLSPSATEILFAIGAGDQVVAADAFSTYPEEAPTTDLSGYEPNVEAIAGYEPDLVVISGDTADLTASLEALDIPVIDNPAPTTIEEGWDGMAMLGIATGHPDETADTVADLRQQVEEAFADAPEGVEGLRVYHELDETFFSASSTSFIGDVYDQFGAVNIADEADADGTGYPQLTEEAIIEADPQLIVITDQVSYTAEDVANRPGWSEVAAVQDGNIVTVSADISSRWGPRLPQLVSTLADAMSQVDEPANG
ncbi:ABC transporter substrate-binding protein [Serinicoccus chungangensis]|uniref:ABC transporter substrate-binding protein n=1 Tax=Serinicoccus chungangensis TaxID=767452 RepID=A0A0W8I0K1_9MICO|nr:ABC transporter substrate-binding protein [Serinicoccus chungangensis]KUG51153.1 ABC transporter substrate-binding protein [Serinicoccus chungangensis]